MDAIVEGNLSKYDNVEACEVIATMLLTYPTAGLEFSHVGLKICSDLVGEMHAHKDRLLRAGVCETIVLVMENHGHEHSSIPLLGSVALHYLLQLDVNRKDLIPQKLLVRAGNLLLNAMQSTDTKYGDVAVRGAAGMGWLIKNRNKAQKVRLIDLGVCQVFMSIVETFDEDTDEETVDLVLKSFYEMMKGIERAPDFATSSAYRVPINVLRLYNTRNAEITTLVCELIPILAKFSPHATRYLCQAGASQAVAVGLVSFDLENVSFAYGAMHAIIVCINKDVENEVAKLANSTSCNAIVAVLRKFGAEDEDIATTGCDLVHAIAANSSTGRGIFRYVGAHFAVRNAIHSNGKTLAMERLKGM